MPQSKAEKPIYDENKGDKGSARQALSDEYVKVPLPDPLIGSTYSGSDPMPHTNLYAAIHNEWPPELVVKFVKAGGDPNYVRSSTYGEFNKTALLLAVSTGQIGTVEALVKNGARLDKPDELIRNAIVSGAAMVRKMFELGLKVDMTKHADKIIDGLANTDAAPAVLTELTRRGFKLSTKHSVEENDALNEIVRNARWQYDAADKQRTFAMIDELVKAGAKIDARGGWGRSALQCAVDGSNVELVEKLLKAGADPNFKDDDGDTAIMIAAKNGHTHGAKMIELLFKYGANARATNNDGATALHYNTPNERWSDRNVTHIARILVEHGADVNARDAKGNTPATSLFTGRFNRSDLLYEMNAVEYVKFLADKGADLNARNSQGNDLLSIAKQYHANADGLNEKAAAALVKFLGDRNCSSNYDNTCRLRNIAYKVGLEGVGVNLTYSRVEPTARPGGH